MSKDTEEEYSDLNKKLETCSFCKKEVYFAQDDSPLEGGSNNPPYRCPECGHKYWVLTWRDNSLDLHRNAWDDAINAAIEIAEGWKVPYAKSHDAIQQNIVATEIVEAISKLKGESDE